MRLDHFMPYDPVMADLPTGVLDVSPHNETHRHVRVVDQNWEGQQLHVLCPEDHLRQCLADVIEYAGHDLTDAVWDWTVAL